MTYRAAGVLAAALVFAASSGVFAETSSPPAPTAGAKVAKASDKNDPDKIICKTEDTTGTRLGAKRVCHTRSEWAEMHRITQQSVEGVQAQSYQNNPMVK